MEEIDKLVEEEKKLSERSNFHYYTIDKIGEEGKKYYIKANDREGSFEVSEKPFDDMLFLELNEYCYFCDFNEVTTDKHHIIRKCDGGGNEPENIIGLCPNHHEVIHKRVYILLFSNGYYYLKPADTSLKIISPHQRQLTLKRRIPIFSIKNSDNLKITGDLTSKARICTKDFYRSRRVQYRRNRGVPKETEVCT